MSTVPLCGTQACQGLVKLEAEPASGRRAYANVDSMKNNDLQNFLVDKCTIQSVRHKGLKRLIEDDDDRGIRRDLVGRVRNVLTVLIAAADMDGVQGPPGWRIHPLSGDRAGTWSISVSGNWRITFDIEQGKIANLDLEDYH